ncbi:MAG: SagB/ThcOx family dehydrogenase [Candidatus Omnitrophica bacterium]|nr:SagB/ThcOx family dehydrogenase [Candidatus Omnitrophota bacterium]
MQVRKILTACFTLAILAAYSAAVSAESAGSIKLPDPETQGGKPLMQALKERMSQRSFSSKDIPLQVMSDMLWAANGISRPATGLRTAPSARNMQEIDIYAAMASGLYLYDAKTNTLVKVSNDDLRAASGAQPFVKDAPVNLIFVADVSKMGKMAAADADFYVATDTGFVSQNVYLYCASAGLATVVRGLVDRPALAKAMKLRSGQKIILAQTVGYPG